MVAFKLLTVTVHRVDVAQISQDLSYKVLSTMSQHFFAFGLFVKDFGVTPLYTISLLLCYDTI